MVLVAVWAPRWALLKGASLVFLRHTVNSKSARIQASAGATREILLIPTKSSTLS
jgi:hypothetical protein